jgi:hypothetical protein
LPAKFRQCFSRHFICPLVRQKSRALATFLH